MENRKVLFKKLLRKGFEELQSRKGIITAMKNTRISYSYWKRHFFCLILILYQKPKSANNFRERLCLPIHNINYKEVNNTVFKNLSLATPKIWKKFIELTLNLHMCITDFFYQTDEQSQCSIKDNFNTNFYPECEIILLKVKCIS